MQYPGIVFLLIISFTLNSQHLDDYSIYGGLSKPLDTAPKGNIIKNSINSDYNNSSRDYYIYIPQQYDGSQEAALMVFQDGHFYIDEEGPYFTTTVLDNLIFRNEIPVTIALFINPGHYNSQYPDNLFYSSHRSSEYDEMSDRYINFLAEELLPLLEKDYLISSDPKMRVIGGLSSGGICAFTAAWHRPDLFGKVISHSGSFTNIRGGHTYPTLIRNTPKKDIKIFLQCGTNDLDLSFGNWWLSNLQLQAALEYKGYEHYWVPGTGNHDGKHGGTILPETIKWIFSDVMTERNHPERLYHEVIQIDSFYKELEDSGHIVFTGSSSIRMWNSINDDFPGHEIINTGFGGSQMSDLNHYMKDLILDYHPSKIFIYEGDNDLEAGKSTQEVINDFKEGIEKIKNNFPNTPIYLLSPKPSIARWNLRFNYLILHKAMQEWCKQQENVKYIDVWTPMLTDKGQLLADLFIEDGLHMNRKGYELWKNVISPYLSN